MIEKTIDNSKISTSFRTSIIKIIMKTFGFSFSIFEVFIDY